MVDNKSERSVNGSVPVLESCSFRLFHSVFNGDQNTRVDGYRFLVVTMGCSFRRPRGNCHFAPNWYDVRPAETQAGVQLARAEDGHGSALIGRSFVVGIGLGPTPGIVAAEQQKR